MRLKLLGAFLTVATLIVIIGGISIVSVNRLESDIKEIAEEEIPQLHKLFTINNIANMIALEMGVFLNPKSTDEELIEAKKKIEDLRVVYRDNIGDLHSNSFSPEETVLFEDFNIEIKLWADSNNAVIALSDELRSTGIHDPATALYQFEEYRTRHHEMIEYAITEIDGRHLSKDHDFTNCEYEEWLNSNEVKNPRLLAIINSTKSNHAKFRSDFMEIHELINQGDLESANTLFHEVLLPESDQVFVAMDEIIQEFSNAKALLDEMIKLDHDQSRLHASRTLHDLEELVESRLVHAEDIGHLAEKHAKQSQLLVILSTILCILIAVGFSIVFGNSLHNKLSKVASKISSASREAKSASDHLSSASAQLATSSSEQSASVEETSSALEELTSMLEKDTNLARRTSSSASDSSGSVTSGIETINQLESGLDKASTASNSLTSAMKEIGDSSDEISKIIKTIDEIAFQTNILALNAAVEAARAGEFGAGFAVVADEVRALAGRAAEAASETQKLIQNSVERSMRGVQYTEEVSSHLKDILNSANDASQVFSSISNSVNSVEHSMSELGTSLEEQNSGLTSINTSVAQISSATQSNAANAEEAAASAEELSEQANSLRAVAGELQIILEGSKAQNEQLTLPSQMAENLV